MSQKSANCPITTEIRILIIYQSSIALILILEANPKPYKPNPTLAPTVVLDRKPNPNKPEH